MIYWVSYIRRCFFNYSRVTFCLYVVAVLLRLLLRVLFCFFKENVRSSIPEEREGEYKKRRLYITKKKREEVGEEEEE